MKVLYFLYLTAVFFAAYRFSAGTKNRLFHFCLIIWVLAQPVLDSREFTLSFQALFFDLHLSRILTPILIVMLLHRIYKRGKGDNSFLSRTTGLPYERWMLLFVVIALISITANTISGNLTARQLTLLVSGQMFFILIYFATKTFYDQTANKRLMTLLIGFSVFNTMVCLVQVFIQRDFFWFGVTRRAFGDIYRAIGIFPAEYTLAFFHITIVMLLLVQRKKYYTLIALNCVPVVLSFHRLSLGILIATMVFYLLFTGKPKRILVTSLLTATASVFLILYFHGFKGVTFAEISDSVLYRQRLAEDTLAGRLAQWGNALTLMKHHLLGVGSYDSETYFAAAAKIGQVYDLELFDMDARQVIGTRRVGLIVHNGFLGAGVKHGFLGTFAFLMFCVSTAHFYFRRYQQSKTAYSLIPLLVALAWLLYQTTQDFSNLVTYHSIHYAILIAIFANQKHHARFPNERTSAHTVPEP